MTTLAQQAAAVERAAVNQAGFVRRLAELVDARKRSRDELEIQCEWLPALQDAANTLRKLADGRCEHT